MLTTPRLAIRLVDHTGEPEMLLVAGLEPATWAGVQESLLYLLSYTNIAFRLSARTLLTETRNVFVLMFFLQRRMKVSNCPNFIHSNCASVTPSDYGITTTKFKHTPNFFHLPICDHNLYRFCSVFKFGASSWFRSRYLRVINTLLSRLS